MLCHSMGCSPPGSSVHAPGKSGVGGHFSGDLPNTGIKLGSPALQEDSLSFFKLINLFLAALGFNCGPWAQLPLSIWDL